MRTSRGRLFKGVTNSKVYRRSLQMETNDSQEETEGFIIKKVKTHTLTEMLEQLR